MLHYNNPGFTHLVHLCVLSASVVKKLLTESTEYTETLRLSAFVVKLCASLCPLWLSFSRKLSGCAQDDIALRLSAFAVKNNKSRKFGNLQVLI